ncbi:uncharacterized protein KY384_002351 [Bacidia gigantensis]|uniref:uncharacterized protein n=1 Tax=Bacidia gigantensis TaxID=2732470 RepID=UPI001D04B10C|nr:uncharacterized protein KY384_002351 [Bacidia gigantensis]KAG8532474.1 hypothetical protein KY384_002351 [Bacidia gigantensis]
MVATPTVLENGPRPDEKTGLLSRVRNSGRGRISTRTSDGLARVTLREQSRKSYWRLYKYLILLVLIYLVCRRYVVYSPLWFFSIASKWLFPFSMNGGQPPWYDAPPGDNGTSRTSQEIPDYVFEYAPFVHLFSDEEYWPTDMSDHIPHTHPAIGYDPITNSNPILNISNLNLLNQYEHGRHVFLTSNDDVEDHPPWIKGEQNIPTKFTYPPKHSRNLKDYNKPKTNGSKPTHGGYSPAPAILITVPKGNNTLDAFWFFFYSFNRGNSVFNIRFGNHVGDWEHTLIRFQHGRPAAVFFSEHNFGSAYSYHAVEKIGKRPVLYSAVGTHAMYATSGLHPYILPLGLLHDETDRGPLWDPALNTKSYTFDHVACTVRPSMRNPDAETGWFYYNGHWGDKHYPLDDGRQYGFVGEYHYVNGPLGPRFKHLGRRKMCQGAFEDPCEIKEWLGGDLEVKMGKEVGVGEEWPEGETMPPGLIGDERSKP